MMCSKVLDTGVVNCIILDHDGEDSVLIKVEISATFIGGLRRIVEKGL